MVLDALGKRVLHVFACLRRSPGSMHVRACVWIARGGNGSRLPGECEAISPGGARGRRDRPRDRAERSDREGPLHETQELSSSLTPYSASYY